MNERDLQVGDWVRHPEFGDGLILDAKGAGDSASVLVSFPDKSQRRLVIKFARLSRVEPPTGQTLKTGRQREEKPARAKARRKKAESR